MRFLSRTFSRGRRRATLASAVNITLLTFGATSCSRPSSSAPPIVSSGRAGIPEGETRLPTGARLDPAAPSISLGSMPLAMVIAPTGDRVVVLLNGWREHGFQVVDRATGRIVQTVIQPAAFIGVAFAPDGNTLYVSGGNQDVIYRYAWRDGSASLTDSLILAPRTARQSGRRYPAGIAPSPDGRMLYVAENLADSVAVIDLANGRVVQRFATERYPYGVAVAASGAVYVSAWGGHTVSTFSPTGGGLLRDDGPIVVDRHPSALVLNATGSRLFVASGSTDRIDVLNTRSREITNRLLDPPPAGPGEGSTPNALALSADGARLFVAEADNNAVAVFDLASGSAGMTSPHGADRLVGRIPVDWYPTAVVAAHDTLMVLSGKGNGTAPNPDGPDPLHARAAGSHAYTLGQTSGTLMTLMLAQASPTTLAPLSNRVARAQGWSNRATHAAGPAGAYPPFTHVIYVVKENRTYDQVLGDLPIGDGDTALVFFPRTVSPNHHALAERFGVFDRFFTNAEVSPDGHNWSMAAYATDYLEKTVPSNYSGRGRTYDYEGTNRGFDRSDIPIEDVSEPARGYLWDLAARAKITLRNYGEFVVSDTVAGRAIYVGDKPILAANTNPDYPGFDLNQLDQARLSVWLKEFAGYIRSGVMPQLEIVRLPNDHTAGARAGSRTPRAYMADNDLALGRMIEALSRSPFWKNTVVFVVEDDAQNGPDHVDSHRAPAFVISAYNGGDVVHRWTNTTDVIATMSEILHTGSLSQFDYYGRPLRDIWTTTPNLAPYVAIVPDVSLDEKNTKTSLGAAASGRLDLTEEDRADENTFNRILWTAIKGKNTPYPGIVHVSGLEWRRAR
ncbi:MAG: bifunctional YncE family protein/alkaline phosphatase family protein [Gemmatimonadaceae bacterium]